MAVTTVLITPKLRKERWRTEPCPSWSKCVLASDLCNLCTLLAPCTWSLPGSIIGNYHTKDSSGNKRLPSVLHSLNSMSKACPSWLKMHVGWGCWYPTYPAWTLSLPTSAATSKKNTSSLEYARVCWLGILYTVHPASILTVPGSIVRKYHSKDSPVNPHLPSCLRSLYHLIQIVWK